MKNSAAHINNRRKLRLSLKLLWFIVPFLLSGMGYFILNTDMFRVQFINCTINSLPCNGSQKSYFNQFLGQLIFSIDRDTVSPNILMKYIELKSVMFDKQYPQTLNIKLSARIPLAKLLSQDQYFLADEDGFVYIISSVADTEVPLVRIDIPESIIIGTTVGRSTLQAIKLTSLLKKDYIPFSEIRVKTDENLEVQMDNYVTLFSGAKDLVTQASSLQLILHSSTIDERNISGGQEKKNITKIDLRFDKPVLIY